MHGGPNRNPPFSVRQPIGALAPSLGRSKVNAPADRAEHAQNEQVAAALQWSFEDTQHPQTNALCAASGSGAGLDLQDQLLAGPE